MTESVQLHPISCVRCRRRRIRCNRVLPRCDRCRIHNAECEFPERVKRRSMRHHADLPGNPDGPTSRDGALRSIMQRLQSLEEQSSLPSPAFNSDGQLASSTLSTAPVSTPSTHQALSESSPTSTSMPTPDLDAAATLNDAFEDVRRLKRTSYAKSAITDAIDIPPELAKTWIHNYFTHTSTDLFLSLVNKRLIQLMPDIIGLPHVHFDSSILVLYYAILYYGCTLYTGNTSAQEQVDYPRLCYLGCIRALPDWQREATGSTTDFVAALVMTRVAAQAFDYDLMWEMHKYTSDYARSLNLHNLDGGDYSGLDRVARSDDDRKGFWQLIQIDLYIRLMLDKPPAITADAWKVNLPWLSESSQHPPEAAQAIAFLIQSRMALILIRFFALLENGQQRSRDELRSQTEDLAREIKHLFLEWQADDWITAAPNREQDAMVLVDVLLTGYICIIMIIRKADIVGSSHCQDICKDKDVPDSPLVLDASRQVIRLMTQILSAYPHAETMSAFFGAYGAFIPTACLYSRILHAPDVGAHQADIESLEQLTTCVSAIARSQREFFPFIKAMENLNVELRKALGDSM